MIPDPILYKILPGLGIDYKSKTRDEILRMMIKPESYNPKYVEPGAKQEQVILITFGHITTDRERYYTINFMAVQGGLLNGLYITTKEWYERNKEPEYLKVPRVSISYYYNGKREGPSYVRETSSEEQRIDKWYYDDQEITENQYIKMLFGEIDQATFLVPDLIDRIIDYLM